MRLNDCDLETFGSFLPWRSQSCDISTLKVTMLQCFEDYFPISRPDVFPRITTALTANSAGCGSKAFKVLIAGASPFLSSSFFSSCLQHKQIISLS